MALILDGTTGVPVTTVTGTLPVANGGSGVTTSTGSGANVLGTSPTLTTPSFSSTNGFISLPTIIDSVTAAAPLYFCRAWVNFNGTGTVSIRASGNVSSITDNGTGDYTVNFTTAMADANYSGVTTVGDNAGTGLISNAPTSAAAPTTSTWRVNAFSRSAGAATDSPYVNVAIFR